MLDKYQFTLLIIAVGIAAYLASVQDWHQDKIAILTERLAALDATAQSDIAPLMSGNAKGAAAQKLVARAELEHLSERLSYLAKSVLLLIGFVSLLVVRIVLWSWRTRVSWMVNPEGSRILWLDRAIVLLLAALLLYMSGLHLMHDVPAMFRN